MVSDVASYDGLPGPKSKGCKTQRRGVPRSGLGAWKIFMQKKDTKGDGFIFVERVGRMNEVRSGIIKSLMNNEGHS